MPETPIDRNEIAENVLHYYPRTQAIYLFGSQAKGDAWPPSDVDIAVLLPHDEAKATGRAYSV